MPETDMLLMFTVRSGLGSCLGGVVFLEGSALGNSDLFLGLAL